MEQLIERINKLALPAKAGIVAAVILLITAGTYFLLIADLETAIAGLKNDQEQRDRTLAEKQLIADNLNDKRKEMESILTTAIDNWLSSLSGVSDENRSNFRQGISQIAQHADMNNAAWEIVCNASALHNTNVKRIEELLRRSKRGAI